MLSKLLITNKVIKNLLYQMIDEIMYINEYIDDKNSL